MKMAPLLRAFAARADLPKSVLIHTGQHYDVAMNERLFMDLELPAPDINLEAGSGSHAVQTAEIMQRFEPVLERLAPVELSVVCFRFVPDHIQDDEQALDALNRRIVDDVQAGGEVFLTGTTLRGRYALRACVLHYDTREDDLETLLTVVRRTGAALATT